MRGEYQVPNVLGKVREARARNTLPQSVVEYPPSLLWAMAAPSNGDENAHRALYLHAMIEVGFVGEKPEPDFKMYDVCPVCGYVF